MVSFQNKTELAKPQALFTFEHPLSGDIDCNRYDSRTFTVDVDAEMHGFGGYFETVLYKDIMLSIRPETHSKGWYSIRITMYFMYEAIQLTSVSWFSGMFSWFPIFFPIATPVRVRRGEEIELHFWRLNNGKQVWYEWTVTKPVALPIHNSNGRSYTIGL